eukprot:1851452-Prymnesium_polylepis.1
MAAAPQLGLPVASPIPDACFSVLPVAPAFHCVTAANFAWPPQQMNTFVPMGGCSAMGSAAAAYPPREGTVTCAQASVLLPRDSAPIACAPAGGAILCPPLSAKSDSTSARKTAWHGMEDATIRAIVTKYGTRWDLIAALLPNRSEDAVRNRWHRTQRQAQSNGQPMATALPPGWEPPPPAGPRGPMHSNERWTAEEDQTILEAVRRHGCKWRK